MIKTFKFITQKYLDGMFIMLWLRFDNFVYFKTYLFYCELPIWVDVST